MFFAQGMLNKKIYLQTILLVHFAEFYFYNLKQSGT